MKSQSEPTQMLTEARREQNASEIDTEHLATKAEGADPHSLASETPQHLEESSVNDSENSFPEAHVSAAVSTKQAGRRASHEANDAAPTGSRVHIGTVEIRAVLPRPTAQTAAPQQREPQSERVTQTRMQMGAEPQLARGLAWSFGLVQG